MIYRTEPNHEPFLADMWSLICELHIYDGKTARVIQNSIAANSHVNIAMNELPPINVPQWLDRSNDMQISMNVLIFRALTLPLPYFRQFLASIDFKKGKVIYIFSIEPPTNIRSLDMVPDLPHTAGNLILLERLSATLFADSTAEVVVLSLTKGAGRENESWHDAVTVYINFMVIQWGGDLSEREFVGQIVRGAVFSERAGGISVYVGEDYLFRDDVNCCLKTIRLT
jgi:hypothetical protein